VIYLPSRSVTIVQTSVATLYRASKVAMLTRTTVGGAAVLTGLPEPHVSHWLSKATVRSLPVVTA